MTYFSVLLSMTPVRNRKAIDTSTREAAMKEYPMPNCVATSPATIGPVICPTSMIEPRVPIADPLVLCLLKSAISAEVADVTIERQRPKDMLRRRREIKDLKKKKLPMQTEPMSDPANICGFLPCLSENFPMIGFVRARVIICDERNIPIS